MKMKRRSGDEEEGDQEDEDGKDEDGDDEDGGDDEEDLRGGNSFAARAPRLELKRSLQAGGRGGGGGG